MPASETPTNPRITPPSSDYEGQAASEDPEIAGQPPDAQSSGRPPRSSSRYLDYDSHELLEKISQYEDERRWQRIREGIWISIIAHFLLFSGLTWIPRYVFHQPKLVDPFDAIKQRKNLTYLDELPDALKQVQKAKAPALKPNDTHVDKKTMDALKALEKAKPKPAPPAPAAQPKEAAPQASTPPPPAQLPQQQQPAPLPPSTATPQKQPRDCDGCPEALASTRRGPTFRFLRKLLKTNSSRRCGILLTRPAAA